MNVEKPIAENLYDLSILREMDDEQYVAETVEIFLKVTPDELTELEMAYADGNMNRVNKIAHKIKSGAGILLATKLLHILTNIEEAAKLEKIEVGELIDMASQEFKKIQVALISDLIKIQKDLILEVK